MSTVIQAGVDDPSITTMRLHRALVLSLALHLAALCWLLPSERYRAAPGVDRIMAKRELAVSFRIANPTVTNDDAPHVAAKPQEPSDDRYFASSEVETSAKPLELKPLVIPERAYMERTKGTLRLRLHIDKDGKVERVDILEASPAGVYEGAAIEAATASTFTPALLHGFAVKSVKDIEVNIDPYDTISMP